MPVTSTLLVLSLVLLLLLVLVLQRLGALQQRLHCLQRQLGEAPPLALPPPRSDGRAVIAIEILNPFELAVRETALAGPVARVAPRTIERIVYRRAADQIAEQLAEQGVRAQVTMHVG